MFHRWSGRSGWTMPARVSVTKVCSFVVASVISCRGSGIVGTGLLSYLDGSVIPDGTSPVSIMRRISAARRGLR